MIRGRTDTDDSTQWTAQTGSTRSLTEPSWSSPSQHFACELLDPAIENTSLSIVQRTELSSNLLPLKNMQVPVQDSERDNKFDERKKIAAACNALIERISDAMVRALSDESLTDSDMDSMNESLDIEVGEHQTHSISLLSSQTRPMVSRKRHTSDSIDAVAAHAALMKVNSASQPQLRSVFENSSREGVNDKISSPPKRPERRTSNSDLIEEALSLRKHHIPDMDSETDDHDIARDRKARRSQHTLVRDQVPRASTEGDHHQTKQDVMPKLPRRLEGNQESWNGSTIKLSKGESCLYSSRHTSHSLPLSVSDIETSVMTRIPTLVKSKLPPASWHRIFSTAIEIAQQRPEHTSLSPGADVGDRSASVSTSTSPIATTSQSTVVVLNACEITRLAVSYENKAMRHIVEDLEVKGGAAVPPRPLPPYIPPARCWRAGDLREDSPKVPTRKAISPQQDSAKASASYLTSQYSEGSSKIFLKSGVSFDSVQVRHYAQVLVESPCISSGPAVGLGWNFEELPSMTLDEAESISKESPSCSMILTRHEREVIVRDAGYSQKEIAAAVRRSLKAKHQRRQTILHLSNRNLEEIVEKSRRQVKRILRFGSKERRMLNKTHPKERRKGHRLA